jgi:hypothetical protein
LPQGVALACAYIEDYRPSLLILGGDIIDFYTASTKFKRTGSAERFVVDEITICIAEVLEPLVKAARKYNKQCKIVFVEGNHEYRIKRYIAYQAPVLENFPGLSIEEALQMPRLGIKYVNSRAGNGIYRVNKSLTAMHGTRHGANPAKLTYDDWGSSAIIGHAHKEASFRKNWGCGDRDDIVMASGCLCKAPDFADVDQYTRGFISGWYEPEGSAFHLEHVRIAGNDHTDMFTHTGEYRAYKVKTNDGGTRWAVKRSV